MVNVSSQSTYTSGRAQNYAKKDAVAISALNASVPLFEKRLQEIRVRHGKDGMRPRALTDSEGNFLRDASGTPVPARDANGRPIYQSTHVQAYCLIQSFGHDELAPHDPESWTTAQELGRTLAEERFPGHPALIATEINGRSGCVHNHIVVGAVHPKTGKSIDSNVVTHSRLAIAHDRVLAANGFTQRADMALKSQNAEQAMAAARAAVLADPASAALSPSQRRRRITAAENAVRLHRDTSTSAAQARESRRMHEFDRYQFTERDRMIATDIGTAPPAERFSEIELEARVKEALSDPRFQSWDELSEIAREYRVTIAARGQDVSFGMMLAQPDGTFAEPARAHMRRGGRPGTNKGLGEGFRREDVEAAIERNLSEHIRPMSMVEQWPQSEADRLKQGMRAWYDSGAADAEFERLRAKREDAAAAALAVVAVSVEDELNAGRRARTGSLPAAVAMGAHLPLTTREAAGKSVDGERAPDGIRSRLRRLRSDDPKAQSRLDALTALDEAYAERFERGEAADAEFERRATRIGIGRALLDGKLGARLDPAVKDQLERREAAKAVGNQEFELARDSDNTADYEGHLARSTKTRKLIKAGEYDRAAEMSSTRSGAAAQQRLLDGETKQGEGDQKAKESENQGMGL